MSLPWQSDGLTINQAAAVLGVSEKTIRNRIGTGMIPARKVSLPAGGASWRIDREWIQANAPPERVPELPERQPGQERSGNRSGSGPEVVPERSGNRDVDPVAFLNRSVDAGSRSVTDPVASIVSEQAQHLQRVEQDVQAIKAYIAGDLGALLRDRLSGVPTRDDIAEATTAAVEAAIGPLLARVTDAAEATRAGMEQSLAGLATRDDLAALESRLDRQQTAPVLSEAIAAAVAPVLQEIQALRAAQEAKDAELAQLTTRLQQTEAQLQETNRVGDPPPIQIQRPWWMFWAD